MTTYKLVVRRAAVTALSSHRARKTHKRDVRGLIHSESQVR